MKKIFTLIIAMFMVFGMATAQTTVNEGVFSHMYIGINCGVNQSTVSKYDAWKVDFNNGLKSLTYNANIELGKDVTPITGFSLQVGVAPIYAFNETEPGSHEFTDEGEWKVNRTDVFGNVKFNLMNLFGGYKGYPRRVEIKTVTGIGWNHNFDNEYNPNNFGLQAGLEFDFNLGKNRNWFITFNPMVQTNNLLKGVTEINNGPDEMLTAAKNADLRANVGVAYRLGRGNQNHSFKICDKAYTEEQYAELYAMYDDCMSTVNRVDTVVVEKVVEKVVETPVNTELSNAIIVFTKNSSELNDAEIHRLDIIMAGLDKAGKYLVVGSADSATGTEEINTNLATERANVVKELMNKNGFNNVETTIQIDALKDQSITRCAIIKIG